MRAIRLVLTLAIVAWTGAALAGEKLVLLSPHPKNIQDEFAEAFQAHYRAQTGKDVEVIWMDVGGTSNINRFIQSQFKINPGGIDVDLFFGGGTDPHVQLKGLGLLAPYRVPDEILSRVAPEIGGIPLRDDNYCWYAATMSGFGIVYNKVVLDKRGLAVPRTWEDLARPEYAGWVASADPRKSGSVHMCYEIILQAYGWERGWRIITALGANVHGFSAGAGQTPRDVSLGDAVCGPAIDFYAWTEVQMAGEENIGFAMPEGLTMINGDALSMLKGAPHRETAEAFIRFVLSEDGQKLWLLRKGEPGGPRRYDLGRFSVIPDLYAQVRGRTTVALDPFERRSKFIYDATKGAARYEIVNDLIGSFIIDPHDRLVATWRKAIAQGRADEELTRLSAMPITEAEALDIAREKRWGDPEYRNTKLKEWSALARGRYLPEPVAVDVIRNLPAIIAFLGAIAVFIYLRSRK